MNKILLINGHQYWESSPGKLNNTLVAEAINIFNMANFETSVTSIEIGFDVKEEVEKYLWADYILYFTPVFWFGIPSGFKAYIEKVFSAGKGKLFTDDGRSSGGKYGSGGLLFNKKYMLLTTWNAPSEAFNSHNQYLLENKSVDDIFLNFHSAQKFVGLEKMPSFSLHDVKKNPNIDTFIHRLNIHLIHNFKIDYKI
ncbi:MAG: hypothetical protein AUJ98_07245 [Bacteroidetes bacterium CG2_30_33_31]|nr:MAG: hypothetical protein AUJ98_07245 [Bacteroidetes bacterium CG2_30_33_31]